MSMLIKGLIHLPPPNKILVVAVVMWVSPKAVATTELSLCCQLETSGKGPWDIAWTLDDAPKGLRLLWLLYTSLFQRVGESAFAESHPGLGDPWWIGCRHDKWEMVKEVAQSGYPLSRDCYYLPTQLQWFLEVEQLLLYTDFFVDDDNDNVVDNMTTMMMEGRAPVFLSSPLSFLMHFLMQSGNALWRRMKMSRQGSHWPPSENGIRWWRSVSSLLT